VFWPALAAHRGQHMEVLEQTIKVQFGFLADLPNVLLSKEKSLVFTVYMKYWG
jgi:hypothetical protein